MSNCTWLHEGLIASSSSYSSSSDDSAAKRLGWISLCCGKGARFTTFLTGRESTSQTGCCVYISSVPVTVEIRTTGFLVEQLAQ